jgi:hypothetical protein
VVLEMNKTLDRRPEKNHKRKKPMKSELLISVLLPLVASVWPIGAAAAPEPAQAGRSPVDELPPHISRLTWFGERADWSHDGQRILFVGKTYGDVYEVEVATRIIRPVTHHSSTTSPRREPNEARRPIHHFCRK